MLKIGCISYINTLPLFGGIINGAVPIDAELVYGTPKELNNKLLNGEIDCSLISSVTYLRNKGSLKLLPSFGLAARGAVHSVLLYTKEHPTSLEGKGIILSDESETSIELLKLLCREVWKVTPHFGFGDDAFLIIGDKALTRCFPGYTAIDLSQKWFELTSTSFPFAVMAAKSSLPSHHCEIIENQLHKSYEWGLANPDIIMKRAIERLFLSQKLLQEYYHSLIYRFTLDEAIGLTTFERYL